MSPRKRTNPFVSQRAALYLDAIGSQYGCRPSQIMGIPPELGVSIMFDLYVLKEAGLAQQESETVGGKIVQKRAKWSPEIKHELRRQGVLR